MQVIICSLAALLVAVIFYGWRGYYTALIRRHKMLRERVAYMLWTAANGAESS